MKTAQREGRLPKLCGADIELGNFILGAVGGGGTARQASRALLREIDASFARPEDRARLSLEPSYPRPQEPSLYANPQDWGRKFLDSNGGCVYIDLDHLELCLPEVLSAYDHVAAWHAMLRIARRALNAANAKLPPGQRIHVLVNNSDGTGNAYGSHLDFLITRAAFDNIFERKMHHLLYLAAYQVSSIIFTGQGKVGAENGQPEVAFQLSQRADFFETLTGVQTTYRRPIVNSRDEPLCGAVGLDRLRPEDAAQTADMARLHCIMYDNTLCHGSSLLKVGVMQIILAMLEAEQLDPRLILDDPVDAIVRWSHDPTLRARVPLASGKEVSAVELQLYFFEAAQRFVDAGGCDGVVPRAAEILALWGDTLLKLQAHDVTALARRLDWVLKFCILQRALCQRPHLTWASPQIKHLDHLYSSLDAEQGLYWTYEQHGATEQLVPAARIAHLEHEPPDDTRAWTRAMLLRLAGTDAVQDIDWDHIKFRKAGRGYWPTLRTVHLADPLGFTRAVAEDIIQQADAFDDILDALHATQPAIDATPTLYDWKRPDGTYGSVYPAAPRGLTTTPGNGRTRRDWDEC